MARPLRITVANLPFHVLDRGNNRQTIFLQEEDFIYFLKLLKKYKKELKFKIYHLCLMPNHFHFMIEPTIEGSLPRVNGVNSIFPLPKGHPSAVLRYNLQLTTNNSGEV